MTRIPLILLLCLLAGCTERVVMEPCRDILGKFERGYKTVYEGDAAWFQDPPYYPCLPCSKAYSEQAKYVCFGEVADKGAKP